MFISHVVNFISLKRCHNYYTNIIMSLYNLFTVNSISIIYDCSKYRNLGSSLLLTCSAWGCYSTGSALMPTIDSENATALEIC